MMYFLDYAMYQGALETAQEEFGLGRKLTKQELIAKAKRGGVRLNRKKVEAATDYTGHHERLCERAEDFGLLHACNDTWLEVRTWNNDIRGVMTLFALAVYWMFWGMATVPDWIAVIHLHQTGLWFDRPLLASTTRLELQLSTIGATAMAAFDEQEDTTHAPVASTLFDPAQWHVAHACAAANRVWAGYAKGRVPVHQQPDGETVIRLLGDGSRLGLTGANQLDYVWCTWQHNAPEGRERELSWQRPRAAAILSQILKALRQQPEARFANLYLEALQPRQV